MSKAAIVGEDGRPRDEDETMTVEDTPVKSVDDNLILCSFGGADYEDLDVVTAKQDAC